MDREALQRRIKRAALDLKDVGAHIFNEPAPITLRGQIKFLVAAWRDGVLAETRPHETMDKATAAIRLGVAEGQFRRLPKWGFFQESALAGEVTRSVVEQLTKDNSWWCDLADIDTERTNWTSASAGANTMTARDPDWTRDELILALDLYFRRNPSHISPTDVDVWMLSRTLRRLPIHADRPDPERFRSPKSVYIKMCDFLRFDPEQNVTEHPWEAKEEEVIWDEFASDRERLRRVARAILAGINQLDTTEIESLGDDADEGFEAPEGGLLLSLHLRRERNPSLVAKKKEQVLKRTGTLACEVCGFDFGKVYGSLGAGFIECHHVVPLSQVAPGHQTCLDDLCVVCSNCHRMLHRGGEALTIEALREVLAAPACRDHSICTLQQVQ